MRNAKCEIDPPVGYALVGAGAFGRYCLEQFVSVEAVAIRAVADAIVELAASAAASHDVEACSFDDLLSRDEVELIHLATPPATHRELAIKAMAAGKHVLCEKPLAVTLEDGRAMVDAAKTHGVNLAANLIMRHVPHCERVKAVLESGILGQPIHASFVNDARDEPLGPDHWFWDVRQSGGIFIEHGVHFFDVFQWWFAPDAHRPGVQPAPLAPQLLAAHAGHRPADPRIIEQVHATVRYPPATLTAFYHGFTQATLMDRQQWRIVCERGDITLRQWVPDALAIDALLTHDQVDQLTDLLGGAGVARLGHHHPPSDSATPAKRVTARHKSFDIDGRFHLRATDPRGKDELYRHALRALLTDQARAIRDPSHPRRVTEVNALASIEIAAAATVMAGIDIPT